MVRQKDRPEGAASPPRERLHGTARRGAGGRRAAPGLGTDPSPKPRCYTGWWHGAANGPAGRRSCGVR